jgi:putative transcription factor
LGLRCEICGDEIRGRPKKAFIEGAVLLVCDDCAKHSTHPPVKLKADVKVKPPVSLPLPRRGFQLGRRSKLFRGFESENYSVIEGYGNLIKRLRECKGWSQEKLASKIGEKSSLISKLETEKIFPTFEVARKLEHVLGVKILTETV